MAFVAVSSLAVAIASPASAQQEFYRGNKLSVVVGLAPGGVPTNRNLDAFCTSRIIEVTPQKEIVFDLRIEDTSKNEPLPLSSFRADFLAICAAEWRC